MDVFNSVGPRYEEVLVTALEPQTPKIIKGEILDLQICPHRAVKDDDAFFQCVEKIIHFQMPSADCQFCLWRLQDFNARPNAFDVVVTDLSMPGMSGFELARGVLATRPDIPLLMTSGYVRPQDEEAAHSIGVRAVILKPNTADDLGKMLDRLFKAPER